LMSLILWDNQLTHINITHNTALESLYLKYNPLTPDTIDYLETIDWINFLNW